MNRADSQSPSGVLGVCRGGFRALAPTYGKMGFSPLPGF